MTFDKPQLYQRQEVNQKSISPSYLYIDGYQIFLGSLCCSFVLHSTTVCINKTVRRHIILKGRWTDWFILKTKVIRHQNNEMRIMRGWGPACKMTDVCLNLEICSSQSSGHSSIRAKFTWRSHSCIRLLAFAMS